MAHEARGMALEEITSASPETLGLLMLKTDLHATRLDNHTQLAAVSDAIADGMAVAKSVRKRFPGLTPREIAGELGIPVVASDTDPLVGSIWRYAEYRLRPARIVLYKRGLAPLEQALTDGLAARLLGHATMQDVFVAHELYHHAEAIRPDVPIASRHQVTLLQIGKWRWRTGVATLGEIAAGSFSQALLDLPYHPKVLDCVAWPLLRELQSVSPAGDAKRDR
jgi:hypothetical protein